VSRIKIFARDCWVVDGESVVNLLLAALKIHCSPTTKELLDEFGTFIVELRGPRTIAVRSRRIS
jgi:hypothetical protein